MPIVDMSDQEIWSGIEACNKHIEAIAKHQRFVATGEGNPPDENARLKMMISNYGSCKISNSLSRVTPLNLPGGMLARRAMHKLRHAHFEVDSRRLRNVCAIMIE